MAREFQARELTLILASIASLGFSSFQNRDTDLHVDSTPLFRSSIRNPRNVFNRWSFEDDEAAAQAGQANAGSSTRAIPCPPLSLHQPVRVGRRRTTSSSSHAEGRLELDFEARSQEPEAETNRRARRSQELDRAVRPSPRRELYDG